MRRALIVSAIIGLMVGGLFSIPTSEGQGGACNRTSKTVDVAFTVYGERSFECRDLVIQEPITVTQGGTLTISNSTLDIVAPGLIHVEAGGRLVLASSVETNTATNRIQVDHGGFSERRWFVDLTLDGDAFGLADVWAWNGKGDLRLDFGSVNGPANLLMSIPTKTQEDGIVTDHMPWRLAASNGTAANHTIFDQLPSSPQQKEITMQIPDDSDQDPPVWSMETTATPPNGDEYSRSTSTTLHWSPADDSVTDRPNRAVDHYELHHTAPGGAEDTILVGDTPSPQTSMSGLGPGKHTFRLRPVDLNGIPGDFSNESHVVVDLLRPDAEVRVAPALPTGQNGWYTQAPTVTIDGQDQGGSGLGSVSYRIKAQAPWTPYTEPFLVSTSGDHLIEVKVIDRAGNQATLGERLRVDLDPPTVYVKNATSPGATGWHTGPVELTVDAEDSASGIGTMEYRVASGTWTPFQEPLIITHSGSHEVKVRAVDASGNPSVEASHIVHIDASAPMAPTPQWTVLDGGGVQADWTGNPPNDLVSGISRAFIERGTESGQVTSRIEVALHRSIHVVGPYSSGEHWFRVAVEDLAGNTGNGPWKKVSVASLGTDNVQDDEILAVRGSLPLTFEPVGDFSATEVRFYVDGALIESSNSPKSTFHWDTTNFEDGEHSIRIIGVDAEGYSQESFQTYMVRNGYGATMSDHITAVLIAASLAVLAAVAGVVGVQRWRRWQDVIEGSASKHALSKHAPTHPVFEAAKLTHLVATIVSALCLTALLAFPALLGTQSMRSILTTVIIVTSVLVVVQVASLALMGLQKRRIANEPHLTRYRGQPLQFDGTLWNPRNPAGGEEEIQFRSVSKGGRKGQ